MPKAARGPRAMLPADLTIGDRVIVRRRLADTPGHLTDVIGHVEGCNPLVVRPQSVGGFRSDAATITIPDELIAVVKKLAPKTVRNSDIRALELATAAAFPGIEHTLTTDGNWLLRAGDGITERSNSAVPIGRSAGLGGVPIDEIDDFYRRHQLPTRLLIPDRIGRPAAALVAREKQDWQVGPDIIIMSKSLKDFPVHPAPEACDGRFRLTIDTQPDSRWLDLYHFRGRRLPVHALNLLRETIDGTMGFASVVDTSNNTVVAITRATITSSPDGRRWLGFSAVEVAEHYRRQGLATRLGAFVLHWGSQHGADLAYLHVIASNSAGIGLYDGLGFEEHHRHRCAQRTASQ